MSAEQPQKTSWADDAQEEASSAAAALEQQQKNNSSSNPEGKADGAQGEDQTNLIESSYDVAVSLADMQGSADSPLSSVSRFEDLGLSSELLKGLYLLRFIKPSKIQAKALPLLLQNPPANMIGQSQSGTGKTAAFVLTMLSRVDFSLNQPQALCLCPSRELARQILTVVNSMGQFTPVKTQYAVPQGIERGQKIDAHIVVGTPGTVLDQIKRRTLPVQHIKVFVLDEADNMLDQQGLGDQSMRVKMTMPKTAQILLFSATFPEHVINYAAKFAPNANKITLKHEELTVKGIKQLYLDCANDEAKYSAILSMYGLMVMGASIIFVKRRETANELQKRLEGDGHTVASLHGAYEGHERDKVIDAFRDGTANVLITTNVLSRGIDVAAVSMVVNYDIPELQDRSPDYETYLHRIGRTGRFGRVGVSITFVHDRKSWEQMHAIEQHFGVEMVRINLDEDWEVAEKELKRVLRSAKAGANAKPQYAGVGAGYYEE